MTDRGTPRNAAISAGSSKGWPECCLVVTADIVGSVGPFNPLRVAGGLHLPACAPFGILHSRSHDKPREHCSTPRKFLDHLRERASASRTSAPGATAPLVLRQMTSILRLAPGSPPYLATWACPVVGPAGNV